MQKQTPSPIKPALPAELTDFKTVPRQIRSNSWTPERQKAFIENLAETANVRLSAAMVNMSKISAYNLKNHPQGGEFKRAWDAAIDFSVSRLKDVAFERAVDGRLEPVWQGGKLVGHKRVYSDSMLMFLLKQYGTDSSGKNVTVNYVRTRANVEAHSGSATSGAEAEATTMTVRSSKPSMQDDRRQLEAAKVIESFDGVVLDTAAQAEITAALVGCAAQQRELGGTYDDPETTTFTAGKDTPLWLGSFEPPHGWVEDVEPFDPAEPSWQAIGDDRYLETPLLPDEPDVKDDHA